MSELSEEEQASNYSRFRGKCREMSEAACAADPTLTLVPGDNDIPF